MFEVSVEQSFRAQHAVTVNGIDEEPHDHNWKVEIFVSGPSLDDDGLLLDFLALERDLTLAVSPLKDVDLNTCELLKGKNPSAEHVAMYFAACLEGTILPPNKLESITVTEAPHCKAIYHP